MAPKNAIFLLFQKSIGSENSLKKPLKILVVIELSVSTLNGRN
jgi:hypothetical protein